MKAFPTRSSYTYRIPLDDRRAWRKIERLMALDSGYFIRELKDSEVPNSGAVKNWAVKFYESKETRGDQPDELRGGTIPGLHEYRYSLDWEPTPETELIEMRHANGGGTKLKGEYRIGTHDPRLPEYAPVDFTVAWTPGEIKKMYDGEPVPNKLDYSRDPPMMEADVARRKFRQMIHDHAHEDGMNKLEKALQEYVENCEHKHILEDNGRGPVVAYCEDCGHRWRDDAEFNEVQNDGGNVVGAVA